MARVLCFLLSLLTSTLRSRLSLQLETAALRQQLSLYRARGRRPRIGPADRLLWSVLAKLWSQWREALLFVQPQTVTLWQKRRFREYWRARSQGGRPGRPAIAQVVRRILNLAAAEWIDEYGMSWLAAAPRIRLLPDTDKRPPYPMSWEEQGALLSLLPDHLANMALFGVNTGCRDGEMCGLRWDWEVKVPQLDTSVFIIPSRHVKNREDRLVVLNRVALSVIESMRGQHSTHVFSFKGNPLTRMMNTAWLRARKMAGLTQVRVHDLKHTFGRRLRAAGVSFEDRQDLLGHKSGRMTTHYSAAELSALIESANKVCERGERKPELVVLRRLSVS